MHWLCQACQRHSLAVTWESSYIPCFVQGFWYFKFSLSRMNCSQAAWSVLQYKQLSESAPSRQCTMSWVRARILVLPSKDSKLWTATVCKCIQPMLDMLAFYLNRRCCDSLWVSNQAQQADRINYDPAANLIWAEPLAQGNKRLECPQSRPSTMQHEVARESESQLLIAVKE